MLRRGAARSNNSSIFNFLRSLHNGFHDGCILINSAQEFIFSHILTNTCLFSFDNSQSKRYEVMSLVVLVYVSLMINGVEHPLRYQLIICVSSLEKLFIQILCLFFNQIFLLLSCVNSLCILDITHLSDI